MTRARGTVPGVVGFLAGILAVEVGGLRTVDVGKERGSWSGL